MKKRKILIAISVLLVLFWMVLVFLLSNEVAEDSTKTSGNVIRIIFRLFQPNITEETLEHRIEFAQPIIRKLTHFLLYFIGGILIYNMLMQIKVEKLFIKSFFWGTMYAMTDETHQLLVPGRSGEIRDVIIDTTGVLLGVLIISFLVHIRGNIKWQRKRKLKERR